MASFDYIKAQQSALTLIQKFGQKVTLAKVFSNYDPVSGVTTPTLITPSDAWVVSLPASSAKLDFDDQFAEDLRIGKTRLFYMAARGLVFKPESGVYMTYQGATWEIIGATPLNPAGTPLIYTVGARISNAAGGLVSQGDFNLDFNADFLNPETI